MDNELPDDAMTFSALQDYEAKRSGVLKRGYNIGEVDSFFGRAVYMLKMYEEGNYIDPRIGDTLTSQKVLERKFPRNNNGYDMKEVDTLINRIVLALKYWESHHGNLEFGLNKRKPKFRKVKFNGEITEMDITGLSPEELNEVEVIEEAEDLKETMGAEEESVTSFFGGGEEASFDLLEAGNSDTEDSLLGADDDDDDFEVPDESQLVSEEAPEDETVFENTEEDDMVFTDVEEEPVEEELVEEPSHVVFSKMKSNRARTEEAYADTVISLPDDWKTYTQSSRKTH